MTLVLDVLFVIGVLNIYISNHHYYIIIVDCEELHEEEVRL